MSPPVRGAGAGVAMALAAACLFAANGTVSKVVLAAGVEATRLTALRTLGAFVVLAALLAVVAPRRLRLRRREVGFLAVYGVVGVALVQWLYFVAIGRLPVGVALLFEFTAPVLIVVWVRVVRREPVRRRMWAAVALSLAGLGLVARVWVGATLDGVGVAAGLGAAVALAAYFLLGERAVTTRDTLSLTCWSMGAAALAWSVAAPWWSFAPASLGRPTALPGPLAAYEAPLWLLVAWIVLLGTVAPFWLSLGALRHLPATTVGVVATAEPVLAGGVAWVVLGEALAPVQVAGSAVVVLGIALAQTARSARPAPAELDVPVPAVGAAPR